MYPGQGQTAGPRCDLSAERLLKSLFVLTKINSYRQAMPSTLEPMKGPLMRLVRGTEQMKGPSLCPLEMPNESIQTDNLHRPPTCSAACSSYGTGARFRHMSGRRDDASLDPAACSADANAAAPTEHRVRSSPSPPTLQAEDCPGLVSTSTPAQGQSCCLHTSPLPVPISTGSNPPLRQRPEECRLFQEGFRGAHPFSEHSRISILL